MPKNGASEPVALLITGNDANCFFLSEKAKFGCKMLRSNINFGS